MKKKWKIGCAGLLVALVLSLVTRPSLGAKDYKFELEICGQVPDLNDYSFVFFRSDGRDHGLPDNGYALFHNAMRANGLTSLLLTDELFHESGIFFGNRESKCRPLEGGTCFFGELPQMEFPGHSNVVEAIRRTKPCAAAIKAIETNAVVKCIWPAVAAPGREAEPYDFVVSNWIHNWNGYEVHERPSFVEAQEAITACAIKAAFPNVRTPEIIEQPQTVKSRIVMHGRAPVPCRTNVVTGRSFLFQDENGCVFAKLRIKIAHDTLHGWSIEEHRKIYQELFRQVFAELKPSAGAGVIRGRVNYDKKKDVGVVRNLERTKAK